VDSEGGKEELVEDEIGSITSREKGYDAAADVQSTEDENGDNVDY